MNISIRKSSINFLLVTLGALFGNASVGSIDIFLTVFFPIFIAFNSEKLLHLKIGRRILDYYLQFIIFLIFIVYLILRSSFLGINYDEIIYSLWPLKAFLLYWMLINIDEKMEISPFVYFVFIMLIMLLIFGSREDEIGRTVSFFGPNMLYRILIVFFVFSLLISRSYKSFVLKFLCYIASFFAIVLTFSTGSVGAIPALALNFLFLSPFWAFIIILCFGGVVFLIYTTTDLSDIEFDTISRLIYKVLTSSEDSRVVGINTILDTPINVLGNNWEVYEGAWDIGYLYPHNFIIELLIYFGIVGGIASLIIIYSLFLGKKVFQHLHYVYITVFTGALFSGDLSDNYALISFSLFFVFSKLNKKSDGRTYVSKTI